MEVLEILILCYCFTLVKSLNEEGYRLLEWKEGLIDGSNNLWSWNSSDSTPCNWNGVDCTDDFEVISINLYRFNITGKLSSSICGISSLRNFNVSKNMIYGPVPREFGNCSGLEVLDLSTNRIHGEIPVEICGISSLRKLYLDENYLYGKIPDEIGNLTLLEELVIYSNNLTDAIPASISKLKNLRIIRAGLNSLSGPIPPAISECGSLEILGLAQNVLGGHLPDGLDKLRNLTNLLLWQNQLSGEIPPELGNCSNLEMLALKDNDFSGGIPKELGKLTNLKKLYIYRNQLNGTIPGELGNCRSAVEIDFSENRLTGVIPAELGKIQNLVLLHLFENLLQGSIPAELGLLGQLRKIDLSINNLTGVIPVEFQNLPSLEYLQLFDNKLEGRIPPMIGANSNLSVLDLSENRLVGSIPTQVCRYQKLIFLSLGCNRLSGNIPHGVKTCKSLVQLRLGDNKITGSFPVELAGSVNLSAIELNQNRFSGLISSEVGKIKKLERLLLSDNFFVGQISPKIGELTELVSFNISSNRMSGGIPRQLADCTKLQRLDLSRNRFAGIVPEELGNLVNLELLKLSDNRFNGTIPGELGGLLRLTELQIGGNYFSGPIPRKLGQLNTLQIALNISHNNLSREIPPELGNLQMLESLYLNNNQLEGALPDTFGGLSSLLVCNLSYNKLVGLVPNTSVFQRMDGSNFIGNEGLCRTMPNTCEPSSVPSSNTHPDWLEKETSKEKVVSISSVIIGLIALVLTIGVCWFIKHRVPVSSKDHKPDMSDSYYFPKEGFRYQDLLEATGNFSESAVIGRGACGIVYKAIMSDGELIAVKKLKSRGEGSNVDSSFQAEISTLGKIRHRNIVRLYGFCYHQDSNLLLYEYMANGSLGELLHQGTCWLDWNTRYNIALGAAEGLSYLHYGCRPQIIHRDIKSNNILLDENLEAHVGDFGLAKLIDFSHSKSMTAVAGSYGYIAPEYAYTMKVTEKCDIYSFGVVLLELTTGRSPVQPLDQGGDLVTWVRKSIQTKMLTAGIFDDRLDLSTKKTVEEMTLVLKIALFCTSKSPFDRPTMREVIAMLIDAREGSCNSLPSPTSETPLDEDAIHKDEWWMNFGIDDPALQNLAIRILSQTCSSSGCERNWSVFERIHTKRRNRLEHKRLNDLVYTHYNLRLKERQSSRKMDSLIDPISLENIDLTDEWVVEAEDDDVPLLDVSEIDDWMDVVDAIIDVGEGGAAAGHGDP